MTVSSLHCGTCKTDRKHFATIDDKGRPDGRGLQCIWCNHIIINQPYRPSAKERKQAQLYKIARQRGRK